MLYSRRAIVLQRGGIPSRFGGEWARRSCLSVSHALSPPLREVPLFVCQVSIPPMSETSGIDALYSSAEFSVSTHLCSLSFSLSISPEICLGSRWGRSYSTPLASRPEKETESAFPVRFQINPRRGFEPDQNLDVESPCSFLESKLDH